MAGKLYYLHSGDGGSLVNNHFLKCNGGTVYELYRRCDNKTAIPSTGFSAGDAFIFNGTIGVVVEDTPFKSYPPTEDDTRAVWVALDGVVRLKSLDTSVTRADEVYVGPLPIPNGVTPTEDIFVAQKSTIQTKGIEGRYYNIGYCVSKGETYDDDLHLTYEVLLDSSRNGLTRYMAEPQPIES